MEHKIRKDRNDRRRKTKIKKREKEEHGKKKMNENR